MEKGQAIGKKARCCNNRGQVYSTRLPKCVTGFRVQNKTGDFLPRVANGAGVLESQNRNIVISIFTAHHYGVPSYLERNWPGGGTDSELFPLSIDAIIVLSARAKPPFSPDDLR
jgi:hypothetical protein